MRDGFEQDNMEMILEQRTKTWLTLAIGAPVAALLCWGLLVVFSSPLQYMIPFGKTHVDAALVCFGVVKVLWLVSYLWFVIVGFRTHVVWGLINLLLPIATVFFVGNHFQAAKRPVIVYLSGLSLLVLTMIWTRIR